ncbi:MAG: rhodanese-like domain-containing protein [Porphyrobacter sp.]|nr:rhodanese-like domain-containing protein [Porphyrobacter sp.]
MKASCHLLPLAAALLALAACGGDSHSGGQRDAPVSPIGFELAFAGTAAGPEGGDAASEAPAPLIALTPDELARKLAAGEVRLIDVRTDEEVAEGMIPGAEHIPLDRFDPAMLGPADGREVVLYCRSGRRSAIAGAKLAEATGKPAEHLAGGILAWEAAGQPIDKP